MRSIPKPSYAIARLTKKARGSAISDSTIDETSKVESGSTVVGSSMDRHSFCGYDCTILGTQIGSFCSIANSVTIGASGRHPIEWVSTSPVFLSHRDSVKAKFSDHVFTVEAQTVIGNDVWIGEGVKIRAGVTVATGAVIGMGSIVTRDVGPYEIVGGNPAKLIRSRFEPKVVDALMTSQWWTWDEDRLRRTAPHFNDPVEMLTIEGFLA